MALYIHGYTAYQYTAFMYMYLCVCVYIYIYIDGVPEDVERDHINVELLVLYGSLSGLGILFAMFCLVFNWHCRRKP